LTILAATKNETYEIAVKFSSEEVNDNYERNIKVNKVFSDEAPKFSV
jgi:hypothetical protein